jgi:hypothetical protein
LKMLLGQCSTMWIYSISNCTMIITFI